MRQSILQVQQILAIELRKVQFGLRSNVWFQTWTSVQQLEFNYNYLYPFWNHFSMNKRQCFFSSRLKSTGCLTKLFLLCVACSKQCDYRLKTIQAPLILWSLRLGQIRTQESPVILNWIYVKVLLLIINVLLGELFVFWSVTRTPL